MKNRKVSIAAALSVAVVTLVTVLLGAFAAVYCASEHDQRWSQWRDALRVIADQQAAAVALPLWNRDVPQVTSVIQSGMRTREISSIAALTDGKAYVQSRGASWQVVAADKAPSARGMVVEERDVVHHGQAIGHLRVLGSPKFLEDELAARRNSIVVFILVLDATLAASVYLLGWHLMLRPVRALADFASSVRAGNPIAAPPAQARFLGELASLRHSIQAMVDMLDGRYRTLQESEERLKLATKAAQIGIWDWDVVKNKLVWDDQMYRLYGIRKEDFGGAYEAWAQTLAADQFLQAHEDVKATLRGDREFATDFVARLPDGSTRIFKAVATTIRDADGRALRMVGVNIDITDPRRAADRVSALNAKLELRVAERTSQLEAAMNLLANARDAAESATRVKSEFLANMSHELRTPMNAILGMTDLALRSDMSAKQRAYLTRARMAAESLLIIINDILDFSRIEAGKLHIDMREFSLHGVLDRVIANVCVKAQERGLELLLNSSPDVPPLLKGDAFRLEQVLINLCSNAVKFSAQGETIVVTVKSVVSDDEHITLHFSVRDTGVGMTEQQVRALFLPFHPLDASATRRYGATGLGLAICKKLVGLMGGEIGIKSQLGKGSDFFFTAVFGLVAQTSEPITPAPRLRHLRILVLDDSPNSRDVLHNLLRSLGYQPTMACSGVDGLAELERAALSRPYDLVLLDWKIPEMDGFAFAERVRQSAPSLPTPRIIMITAYGDEALRRRAMAQRLGSLAKPVNAATLMEAITQTIGAEAPAAPVERVLPFESSRPTASLRGRHVLLVEDNESDQIVATELLAQVAGMVVALATNGEDALLRVQEQHFDAVLMDVQMPVMDGYQATALIRQEPAHRKLPIIAMTAHAMARDREKCLAVGMNDYISKPFDPTELFAVLGKWMSLDHARADKTPAVVVDPDLPQNAVSFELGLQRCLGRHELYARILGRFLATRQGDADEIRSAIARHDLDGAAAIAHSIISTAGTIGAEGLSDAARALQLAIEAGDEDGLQSLVDTFAQRHAVVTGELTSYFQHQRSA